MNAIDQAIVRACQEPTLTKALAFIAIWECERVIPIAHAFLSGKEIRNADGQGWHTRMATPSEIGIK